VRGNLLKKLLPPFIKPSVKNGQSRPFNRHRPPGLDWGGNKESMHTTKQQRETRQIELVETHNIALSLRRIGDAPGYNGDARRKRALYHAVLMEHCFTTQEQVALRAALNLP